MKIEIKDFAFKDSEQVKQLIKLCHEEDYLLNLLSSNNGENAFAAYFGEKLIGVSFTWKSSFHSNCTYFRILVHPYYQDKAVAETLLENLEKQSQDDLPFQTSLWETSKYLMDTFEKKSYKIIRKTYMPKLDLSTIDYYPFSPEPFYEIKTLEEVAQDKELVNKLTKLVKANYEQTHLANPVADFELTEWEKLIFSEDMMEQLSYVFIEDEEIIAYSFLHETDEEGELELGWCGVREEDQIHTLPQLFLLQIHAAKKLKYKTILGEFDTTDQHAMEILKFFAFEPTPTWITLQK